MALVLGLIHTMLGRATLPLPESGTKSAPQTQAAMGSASPKRPMLLQMLSHFMDLPSKTTQHCGTKQRKAMVPWSKW